MSLEGVLKRPGNVRDLVDIEINGSGYVPEGVWNLSPEEWGSVEGYLSMNRSNPEVTSHYIASISMIDPESPLLTEYSDLVFPALKRKCENSSDFSKDNIPYPYVSYAAALKILGKEPPPPKTDLLDSVLTGMPRLIMSSTGVIPDVLSGTAIILGRSNFHRISPRQQEEIISRIFSKGVSIIAMEAAAELRIAGFDMSQIIMEKDLVRLAEEHFRWCKTVTFQNAPMDQGQIYQAAIAKLLAAEKVEFVDGKLNLVMTKEPSSISVDPLPQTRRFS